MSSNFKRDRFTFDPPVQGAPNPSSNAEGTAPASFALAADVGGPLTFSSPDTPGMPVPSDRTAWDFNPDPRPAGRASSSRTASQR